MARSTFVHKEQAKRRVALILSVLAHGALNRMQIALLLGLSPHSARDYLNYLHGEKLIYIAEWERNPLGRRPLDYYRLGNEPDAPRPPPLTKMERYYRCYAKLKLSDKYDAYLAKARARRYKPQPDDLMLAFFGKELKSKPDPT